MDEAVEIPLSDAEHASRLQPVPVGFVQGALDEGSFKDVHLVMEDIHCRVVCGSSFGQGFRQILGKNEFRVSDYDSSFDGVSQFADISGPMIGTRVRTDQSQLCDRQLSTTARNLSAKGNWPQLSTSRPNPRCGLTILKVVRIPGMDDERHVLESPDDCYLVDNAQLRQSGKDLCRHTVQLDLFCFFEWVGRHSCPFVPRDVIRQPHRPHNSRFYTRLQKPAILEFRSWFLVMKSRFALSKSSFHLLNKSVCTFRSYLRDEREAKSAFGSRAAPGEQRAFFKSSRLQSNSRKNARFQE